MTDAEWRAALDGWQREYMKVTAEASYRLRDALRTARESRAEAAEVVRESRELRRRARELRAAHAALKRHGLKS